MTQLIEVGHLFSQHSLNTYVRCPRRFLLKYIDRQPWPMPEGEEPLSYQEHLRRGRVFHQWLAREHFGLDMAPTVAACDDPQLKTWWEAARGFDRDALPADLREAELPIIVPIGDYRLYARYDYLALDIGGDAVIVDWKTLEVRPFMRTLQSRMQTRVYLYTLVAAGQVLTQGRPISPDRAQMLYWFSNYPDESAVIPYSRVAFERDRQYLSDLVREIASQPREAFGCTENMRLCAHCNYRSLCRREAGEPSGGEDGWLDEDIDFELDVKEVPELEY